MRHVFKLFTALLIAGNANAMSVVVHPSVADEIDTKMIVRIYQGKVKSLPSGGEIMPLNQPSESSAASSFYDKVLNKSASQMKAYWSKMLFTGKGQPPTEVADDKAVIERVANDPKFIGYIEGEPGSDVKVIGTY